MCTNFPCGANLAHHKQKQKPLALSNGSLKLSMFKHTENTLNQTLSLTQTLLHPLKLTHLLTRVNHSVWNFQNHLLSHPNQSLKLHSALSQYCSYWPTVRKVLSLSLLNELLFLLLRFLSLSLSLSLSNFRYWNFMMLPRVFRFSILDLFGFWWFMFGFREKKLRF